MKKVFIVLIFLLLVNSLFGEIVGAGISIMYNYSSHDNGDSDSELKDFLLMPYFRKEFKNSLFVEPFFSFSYREELEESFIYDDFVYDTIEEEVITSSIGLGSRFGKRVYNNKFIQIFLGIKTAVSMDLMPRGDGGLEYDDYFSFRHGTWGDISLDFKVNDNVAITLSHSLLGYSYSYRSTEIDSETNEMILFSVDTTTDAFQPSIGFYILL